MDIVKEAQWVFDTEIAALQATKASLGEDFETIVRLVVNCTGKVIITGMGKPGHIGTKIAASLASLGTPSFFMHPGEAMHGDLGMVAESDVVILMSYSGESDEIVRLLPTLHEIHCTTVAITGNPKSTLAMGCQHRFCFPHFEEACYMHLAPTSSTTNTTTDTTLLSRASLPSARPPATTPPQVRVCPSFHSWDSRPLPSS